MRTRPGVIADMHRAGDWHRNQTGIAQTDD